MDLDLMTHESAMMVSTIRQHVTDCDVNLPIRKSGRVKVKIVIVILSQVDGL
jgi:hypothetical protein